MNEKEPEERGNKEDIKKRKKNEFYCMYDKM